MRKAVSIKSTILARHRRATGRWTMRLARTISATRVGVTMVNLWVWSISPSTVRRCTDAALRRPPRERYHHPRRRSLFPRILQLAPTVACWCRLHRPSTSGIRTDRRTNSSTSSRGAGLYARRRMGVSAVQRNELKSGCCACRFTCSTSGTPSGSAGAYMQNGLSHNDTFPARARRWLFLVGQGEGWVDGVERSRGAILYRESKA